MSLSRLAIIGPGLLGGSIAMSVRRKHPEIHISIWARREEAVDEVLARKIADFASTDLEEVTSGASLIVLCVPIGMMASIAGKIVTFISPDTLITDVGSVKGPVVEALTKVFAERGRFIGSHPMAGSEQTGIEAATAGLFEGAVCIVTPDPSSNPQDVEEVRNFWTMLGGKSRILPPAEHDEVVALVSHLPHIIAATLVNLVCSQNQNSLNFCGNGFRDTTRVASGSPEMWTEIFGSNREQLTKSIRAMIDRLEQVLGMMNDNAKMTQFLRDAKTERDNLNKGK